MSTIGYDSWAVDLANVTSIYPFQGFETIMVLAGVAFWLWWHIAQARTESREFKREMDEYSDKDAVMDIIDKY